MTPPEITIVIPAKNRKYTIRHTLQAILNQTKPVSKVILVDNGSRDGTSQVMVEYAGILSDRGVKTEVLSETKPGASAARNRGLQEVTTPYVMFFDSDDIMAADHCENITKALVRHQSPDILGWDVLYYPLAGKKAHTFRFPQHNILFNHLFHACMSTQRYIAKTELVRKAGAWNEELPVWNDYELGTRLLLLTTDIRRFPTPFLHAPGVSIHIQKDSITGIKFTDRAAYCEKALDAVARALTSAGKTDELIYIELRRIILAGTYLREGDNNASARLLNEVLRRTRSRYRNAAYRMIHRYVAAGGRGVSHLARLL